MGTFAVLLATLLSSSVFASDAAVLRELDVAFTQFELSQPFAGDAREVVASARNNLQQLTPSTSSAIRAKICTKSAVDLLNADKVQEAIWLLIECEMHTEGRYLNERLTTYIERNILVVSKKIGSGINGAMWGTVGKLPVVAKNSKDTDRMFAMLSNTFLKFGVASSRFAQYVGLSSVPHFQVKTIGGVNWSVQTAVADSQVSNIDFKRDFKNYERYKPEWFILDFVSQNTDRHHGNSLVVEDNKIIAIDNELWILTPFFVSSAAMIKKFEVKESIYNRIQGLERQDIDELFGDLFSFYERFIIWQRILKLKKVVVPKGARSVYPSSCQSVF